MNVKRTKGELVISIPEAGEEVIIRFPDYFKARYNGKHSFEVRAGDIEKALELIDHYLVRLARNALEAERDVRRNSPFRCLVYDPETGASMETGMDIPGAPWVEYRDGELQWHNPGGEV